MPKKNPFFLPLTDFSAQFNPMQHQNLSCFLSSQARMEAEPSPEVFAADEVERGDYFADEFSVDDLFDFAGAGDEEEEEGLEAEAENSNSSAISFELPPPPPSSELPLPAMDAAELEWVSRIMDDSFSDIPTSTGALTSALAKPAPPAGRILIPVKAKRSKRGRAGGWVRSETTSSSSSCSSSSSSSSCLTGLGLMGPGPKKRGRKPKAAGSAAGERRCSHCGSQKTPQWRAGPDGPKTLCNACGVRFKSGRLLPEYRPALSPTFLSHVHSNSHRKVLEMRRKKADEDAAHRRCLLLV